MVEQADMRKEMSEWLATRSKYVGFGVAMTAELMIGFWFGIRVILAVGVLGSLNNNSVWGNLQAVVANEVSTKMAKQS